MTTIDSEALKARLDLLAEKFDVPGASLAVLTPDGVTTVATGVLNRDTGAEATTDSLFQIGSITKTYTASLVMRLVERGELDLDAPIRTYLPDFRVADEEVSGTVTLRHLLSHSSGIDGDHFLDTGRGDDVLEKYVASCAELAQQFPLGATMSYCNAGFGIIGRVLEVVTGKVWDQVLRDELFEPIGLEHSFTLPEEVLRFGAACGHVGEPGDLKITPQWGIPRSSGPAGLINATAEDVVRFAEVFINSGKTTQGEQWLSEVAVESMLEPQVAVADPYTLGAHWGVGWILYQEEAGQLVFGHDGSTLGQGAALRIIPGAGVAVALLMNGGGMGDLMTAVLSEVVAETTGVQLRAKLEPVPGASGGDRSTQVGTYARAAATMTFTERDETGLTLTLVNTSELADVMDAEPIVIELEPVADNTYVGRLPGSQSWTPAVFFSLDDGSRYVHLGARATRRIEG